MSKKADVTPIRTEEEEMQHHVDLYKRAVGISNVIGNIFQGEHIECIGNALIINISKYLTVVPEEARKIFIDGLIQTINETENSLKIKKTEH